ncbi:50S ribosomal protein L11 methyltransferase [Ectothiorhodospira lacustris]|uniref:50S ribosomal protein L11 methyltransferase n=1 Tax=Ectothiorhodospira lacustris TaxID=2899127 RepID=UPI001EE78DC3|nr:50S ribosomal protein L11 methyltransferase [Ectothiorhodospira lacustris]MCG5501524.1 50S ribosomal protein L11 methyltransferase [Ectothiorhodospira lacustris]MCG5510859.1 50S ribosomal protein L11 methyltransferase [Ectothiorhodospira lacustris]MCG5522595.1 50S ribosomal protein L11 methyltransferase [Ectothiorhodospira lacustris]
MIQITIPAAAEQTETVEDALLDLGAISVMLRDAGDFPLLEPLPGETPLWPDTLVTGLFAAEADIPALTAALSQGLGLEPSRIHHEILPDQDWVRACMDDFKPIRFGRRLWIVPTWHEAPDPQAVNIRLDPGLAFGTGTHPTTAMCLGWLDRHSPVDQEVLDYGCGSGILAIGALALGARHAWGVDIDPQAMTATRENAQRNGIAPERLHAALPDALPDELRFDLTMANILAGPLIALAPALGRRTRAGGHIILAGLLDRQAEEVASAHDSWFEMSVADQQDGWTLLQGVRRSDIT